MEEARGRGGQARSAPPPGRSSGPAAPPSRTTWPSRGWPASTPRRGATSSPSPSSTRRCSTRCTALEREGFEVTVLPVSRDGRRRSRGGARGHPPRHRAGLGDARQQRDRRDPARRGDRRASPARRASSSTATRCSRSGKIPFDVESAERRTWSRSRPTRCTAPRAWARSTSGASRGSRLLAQIGRRRPRARLPLRHAQRPRHRRLRQGGGELARRGDAGRGAAASWRCASGCGAASWPASIG